MYMAFQFIIHNLQLTNYTEWGHTISSVVVVFHVESESEIRSVVSLVVVELQLVTPY